MRRTRPNWIMTFCLTTSVHLLAIGLQRCRTPARRELLRSSGFGSEAFQFRRDCAGTTAAGELVRPGTSAHCRRWRAYSLSWSGSMFEYLMPLLVMPNLRRHPARPDLPGIGEEGRSSMEKAGAAGLAFRNCATCHRCCIKHQYSAFGVPGLGLKRGPGEDPVIAPTPRRWR